MYESIYADLPRDSVLYAIIINFDWMRFFWFKGWSSCYVSESDVWLIGTGERLQKRQIGELKDI